MYEMYAMKLKVRIFEGKSPELYLAVGHFVLSPACLRENNNYPYKSSRMFTWHVSTMKTR